MSVLASTLMQMLGAEGVQRISQQLGADEQSTQKAVRAALPMLISALGKNAASPEGAEALDRALEKDHDGQLLEDVVQVLGDQAMQQDGQAILRHVLGEKQGLVAKGLGSTAGLDPNAAGQLLAMLAPLVMGGLGKTKREMGLDAQGIARLLGQERQQADSQLGGLARLLDMDGDGDLTDDILGLGSRLLGGLFR